MSALIWERREHGDRCKRGLHLPYRVRKPHWINIHCKLCKHVDIELYEYSYLTPPNNGEEAAA